VSAADLDALDRGVIEAGQLAAQALSRIAALEAQVDSSGPGPPGGEPGPSERVSPSCGGTA
jgi:hypothetical protein